MGKIVVTEFISLDGVVEDPGGAERYRHGGWAFETERGAEGDKFKLEELQEAEAKQRLQLIEAKSIGDGISLVRYGRA